MPRSRMAVSVELIRDVLHLPPTVFIWGVTYDHQQNTLDLDISGVDVPDAERVDAVVHKEYFRFEFRPVPGTERVGSTS